jgi:hypothetical protein
MLPLILNISCQYSDYQSPEGVESNSVPGGGLLTVWSNGKTILGPKEKQLDRPDL